MLSIRTTFAIAFLFVVAGCKPSPPLPPRPSEVALDNLYDSWNLGTMSVADQFSGVSCGSEVKSDPVSGNYIVCTAYMKGYVHQSMWHCSTVQKGGCRMFR